MELPHLGSNKCNKIFDITCYHHKQWLCLDASPPLPWEVLAVAHPLLLCKSPGCPTRSSSSWKQKACFVPLHLSWKSMNLQNIIDIWCFLCAWNNANIIPTRTYITLINAFNKQRWKSYGQATWISSRLPLDSHQLEVSNPKWWKKSSSCCP